MGEERIKKAQRLAKLSKKIGFIGVTLGIGTLGFEVATVVFMPDLTSVAFLGFFISALVISTSVAHITIARGIIERKDWAMSMAKKEMPKWFKWFNPRWLIIMYVVVNVLGIARLILKILM